MALQRTRGLVAAQFLPFAGRRSAAQDLSGGRSPLNARSLGGSNFSLASWSKAPWLWPFLFLAWIVLSETAAILIGGDLGGMSFVLLHFAVNPFFALVVAFFSLVKLRGQSWTGRVATVLGVGLVLFMGYLGFSASFWPMTVLGLRFR